MFLENQDPEFMIIGGTELDESVWDTSRRYLVALAQAEYVAQPSTSPSPHICTATMISRRVVLSAAREFQAAYFLACPTCMVASCYLSRPC